MKEFTKEQREYIANKIVECWKNCHDEHCHGSHDCKNDIGGLINTLIKFGLEDNEIYASILGVGFELTL